MISFLPILLPVFLSAFPLPFESDPNHFPVIDPVLSYATYAGGSGKEAGKAIAVDGAGNAYVAGNTDSPNFPALKTGTGSGQPNLPGLHHRQSQALDLTRTSHRPQALGGVVGVR